MLLIFRRLNEYCTLKIDRENRKVSFTGESTNYKEIQISWRNLWDKCEYHKQSPKEDNSKCELCNKVAEQQDKETKDLPDKKFMQVFENQMKVYGYKMVKWES